MSNFGTQGMAFATPQTPTNEEVLQLRIKEITDTERKNITAICAAAAADRHALGERIWRSKVLEEADVTVCNIRMQRMIEKAREETYHETAVPGPIRKLPAEMLSAVFRYHVEDDLSPWILVKVSKAWMHTAMTTPRLWCRLIVALRPPAVPGTVQHVFNGEPHYSVGNMQLCDNIGKLQGALDRSGAVLPLAIKFKNQIWEGNSKIIASALLQILSSPISERIQDLDVEMISIQNAEYGIDVPIGPFPLLRSITLPSHLGPWTHQFLESVSSTSRRLDSVELTSSVSPELVAHPFWHRVERVVLRQGHRINELNLLTPHLTALEDVKGLPYDWPTRDTTPVVWEKIRQLSLSCDPRYLDRLQLPQLETFTLYDNGSLGRLYPLSEYGQILYPTLVTLDVEIKSPLWPQYTSGAFPTLLNLTLKCGQGDEVITDTLNSVPTVRNLKIIGPPSKTFGFQMLQDLQSDEGPLVCPNLERLTLGEIKSRVRTLKSDNGPLCKSLVQFRMEIGKPLQEFTVFWSYHKEVIDYAAIA